MKTHVMGMEKIEIHYIDGLDRHGKVKRGVRPKLVLDEEESSVKFVEMFTYSGAPQAEGLYHIHISEKERVKIIRVYFRADIGDWYQEVDKVINLDSDEDYMLDEFDRIMREWNNMMISGDPKVKEYCDIHKLSYEDTDYDELKEIVDKPKSHDDRYLDGYWSDILGRYPLSRKK